MKRIYLNKSKGIDLSFTYDPGTIRLGFFFGHMPRDCGWIGINLPFLTIELGWRSPNYDWEFYGK